MRATRVRTAAILLSIAALPFGARIAGKVQAQDSVASVFRQSAGRVARLGYAGGSDGSQRRARGPSRARRHADAGQEHVRFLQLVGRARLRPTWRGRSTRKASPSRSSARCSKAWTSPPIRESTRTASAPSSPPRAVSPSGLPGCRADDPAARRRHVSARLHGARRHRRGHHAVFHRRTQAPSSIAGATPTDRPPASVSAPAFSAGARRSARARRAGRSSGRTGCGRRSSRPTTCAATSRAPSTS